MAEFGGGSDRVVLWGGIHFLAVGALWLVCAHASSLPGWPLGAFGATTAYIVVVGAEDGVADRRVSSGAR
jgi:hypothetical protein